MRAVLYSRFAAFPFESAVSYSSCQPLHTSIQPRLPEYFSSSSGLMPMALLALPAAGYTLSNPPKDQVKGQALMTTANTVGGVLGTFLGGQLLLVWGVSNMLLTGTLLSALGTVIVFLSAENRQTVKK